MAFLLASTAFSVLTTQDIDVARHVVHVTSIRTQGPEDVGRPHGVLGAIGHFERVYVHVNNRRVMRPVGGIRQGDRAFDRAHRLDHVRMMCWEAGPDVPQPAGRACDQRFREERHHVMVIWEFVMDPPHFGGIIVVPPVKFLGRHGMRLLITAR